MSISLLQKITSCAKTRDSHYSIAKLFSVNNVNQILVHPYVTLIVFCYKSHSRFQMYLHSFNQWTFIWTMPLAQSCKLYFIFNPAHITALLMRKYTSYINPGQYEIITKKHVFILSILLFRKI